MQTQLAQGHKQEDKDLGTLELGTGEAVAAAAGTLIPWVLGSRAEAPAHPGKQRLPPQGPRRQSRRKPGKGPCRLPRRLAQNPRKKTFGATPVPRAPRVLPCSAPSPEPLSWSSGRRSNRVGTSNCFACHPVTVATPSGGARRSNRSLRLLPSRFQGGDQTRPRMGKGAARTPPQVSPGPALGTAPGSESGHRQARAWAGQGLGLPFEGRGRRVT